MGIAATFIATQVGIHVDRSFLVIGVTNSDHTEHLIFQRSLPVGSRDDWGVHIELSGQGNSGYDLVKQCILSQASLRVDLVEPLGLEDEYDSIHIELCVANVEWRSLRDGLQKVFVGHEHLLIVG